jgi:flagellin
MVINTNVSASNAAFQLGQSSSALSKSLARLSSGSKITSPADDSAGLGVSMKFGAQINRINATLNNVGNATSFTQTQDGYLQKIGDALNRMSELTVAAQDVTKTTSDRKIYNQEFQALATYINDVTTKDFNGVSLFSSTALNVTTDSEGGSFSMTNISGSYSLAGTTTPSTTTPWSTSSKMDQLVPGFTLGDFFAHGPSTNGSGWGVTGTNTLADAVSRLNGVLSDYNLGAGATYDTQTGKLSLTLAAGESATGTLFAHLGFNLSDLDNTSGGSAKTVETMLTTTTPGTTTGAMDISSISGAKSALTTLKNSINQLATDRATVGSNLTRLNFTGDQLNSLQNNLSAARSRITDVDVAQESTNYARQNILVQSGTAMLAQANNLPQSVLRLLG